MEWTIFGTIVAIVSFLALIISPMLKLNTSITRLTDSVDLLKDLYERTQVDLREHDHRLDDHETRITVLEQKKELTNDK